MVGLPGESRRSVMMTERFLREIGATQGNCSVVTPYPGPVFFKRMVEAGLVVPGDWGRFTGNNPVMFGPGFTPAQVREAKERLRSFFRAQAERQWRRRIRRIIAAPFKVAARLRARMKRTVRPEMT